MSDVKTAIVSEFPICDVPGCEEPAEYDAKTRRGPWGYFCQTHFDQFGCRLGLGMGQKLVLESPEPQSRKDRADKLCKQCGKDCPDDCWNKDTGRYRVLDNPEKTMLMLSMGMYCEEV